MFYYLFNLTSQKSLLSGWTIFSCGQTYLLLQCWQVKWCTITITLHYLIWYSELISFKWLYVYVFLFFSFLASQFWQFHPNFVFSGNTWHDHIEFLNVTGIVPASTLLLDVYWKEMDADTDWVNHSVTSFTYFSVCFLWEGKELLTVLGFTRIWKKSMKDGSSNYYNDNNCNSIPNCFRGIVEYSPF